MNVTIYIQTMGFSSHTTLKNISMLGYLYNLQQASKSKMPKLCTITCFSQGTSLFSHGVNMQVHVIVEQQNNTFPCT